MHSCKTRPRYNTNRMCGWNRATPGRLPRAARAPPRPRFPSSPSVLPPGLHADPPPGVAPRAAGLGVTRRRLRHHNSNYRTRRLSAPAPRSNQNLHFESAGRVLSALLRGGGRLRHGSVSQPSADRWVGCSGAEARRCCGPLGDLTALLLPETTAWGCPVPKEQALL